MQKKFASKYYIQARIFEVSTFFLFLLCSAACNHTTLTETASSSGSPHISIPANQPFIPGGTLQQPNKPTAIIPPRGPLNPSPTIIPGVLGNPTPSPSPKPPVVPSPSPSSSPNPIPSPIPTPPVPPSPVPSPPPGHPSPYPTGSSGIHHPAGILGPNQLNHLKTFSTLPAPYSDWLSQLSSKTPTVLENSGSFTQPPSALYSYTDGTHSSESASTFNALIHFSGAQAYQQTVMYEITGKSVYAENVIKMFRDWSSTVKASYPNPQQDCTDNQQNEWKCENAPLNWAWAMASWFKAAEILKYTYPGWDRGVESQMLNWFESFNIVEMWQRIVFRPDTYKSQYNLNNWDTSAIEALLYYSYLKDDINGVAYVQAYYKRMIDGFQNPSNPNQSDRIYYAPTGEEVETCRDLDHADYGIGSLVQLAEAFWQQGVDLYSYGPKGNSGLPGLAQVLETNSYIEKNTSWPEGLGSNSTLWRPFSGSSWFAYGPQCSLNTSHGYKPGGYQIGYNHFANRLKLNLPNTKRWNDLNADTSYYFHFGLGVITHNGTN